MASLSKGYTNDLHNNFQPLYAVWPPGDPIELGDYGELRDSVFLRLGNVRNLGLTFSEWSDTTKDHWDFKSAGSVKKVSLAAPSTADLTQNSQIGVDHIVFVFNEVDTAINCEDTPEHGRGSFPGLSDDLMPSLGTFRIVVDAPFRSLMESGLATPQEGIVDATRR